MVSQTKLKSRLRKKENPEMKELVGILRKKSDFWKRVAEDLVKPKRQGVKVNLAKISASSKDGDVIVVPGKVLGSGELNKKITLGAFSFSSSALSKIKPTQIEDIKKMAESHKDGKGVKIIA